jgi:hypothetical protein
VGFAALGLGAGLGNDLFFDGDSCGVGFGLFGLGTFPLLCQFFQRRLFLRYLVLPD